MIPELVPSVVPSSAPCSEPQGRQTLRLLSTDPEAPITQASCYIRVGGIDRQPSSAGAGYAEWDSVTGGATGGGSWSGAIPYGTFTCGFYDDDNGLGWVGSVRVLGSDLVPGVVELT